MEIPAIQEFIYFMYKTSEPTWRLSPGEHRSHGLVLLLGGSVTYQIQGKSYTLKAGDAVYLTPGIFREAVSSNMTYAAFDFHMREGSLPFTTVFHCGAVETLQHIVGEFQYEWLQKSPGYQLKCAGIFFALLHSLLYGSDTGRINPHVQKMKNFIIRHFQEEITLQTMAGLTGLSAVYCGALFKSAQGISLSRFVNQIRVQKAAALLEEGLLNISQIADLCGFHDVYYFSRIFKKMNGLSPSRYRAAGKTMKHTA